MSRYDLVTFGVIAIIVVGVISAAVLAVRETDRKTELCQTRCVGEDMILRRVSDNACECWVSAETVLIPIRAKENDK